MRIGEAAEGLGDDDEAESHFTTSFELLKKLRTVEKFEPAAGLVRILGRRGRMEDAFAFLAELEGIGPDLWGMSKVLAARGYLNHLQDPEAGAREYAQAFDYLRMVGKPYQIARFCRDSPFDLRGCTSRLRSEAEPDVPSRD